MSDDVLAEQTSPPPPPRPRDRLERRATDRWLGGVAGGLADHFGIDVTLVRIAFAALAVFGGSGVLLYALGWLLIPETGRDEAVATRAVRSTGANEGVAFWLGIAFVALAVVTFADETGLVDSSIGAPLVLIGVGVALFQWDRSRGDDDAPAQSAAPPVVGPASAPSAVSGASAPVTASGPAASHDPLGEPGVAPSARPRRVRRSRQPRERSALGRIGLALLLLLAGVAWGLDQLDVVDVSWRIGAGLALLLVGVVLLVGAWYGRARWFVLVGLLLLPGALGAAAVEATGLPHADGVADRTLAPFTSGDIGTHDLLAGALRLDLVELHFADGEVVSIDAAVAFGKLVVVVPEGVDVRYQARVRGGELTLLGETVEGTDLERIDRLSATDPVATLDLDLDVGFGSLELVRVDRPAMTLEAP